MQKWAVINLHVFVLGYSLLLTLRWPLAQCCLKLAQWFFFLVAVFLESSQLENHFQNNMVTSSSCK